MMIMIIIVDDDRHDDHNNDHDSLPPRPLSGSISHILQKPGLNNLFRSCCWAQLSGLAGAWTWKFQAETLVEFIREWSDISR